MILGLPRGIEGVVPEGAPSPDISPVVVTRDLQGVWAGVWSQSTGAELILLYKLYN
jgi:hypothetical protein